MMNRARDAWLCGYAAALATVWRSNHDDQSVVTAMQSDGILVRHLEKAGVEEEDLAAIKKAFERSGA